MRQWNLRGPVRGTHPRIPDELKMQLARDGIEYREVPLAGGDGTAENVRPAGEAAT